MALDNAQMIDAQYILANEGVEAFYEFLFENGEDYGRLALGVTKNNTWQGQLANGFAASAAEHNDRDLSFGSPDWIAINEILAGAHIATYVTNGGVEPSWDQIQNYHNTIYEGFGLPLDAWFPNRMLDNSDDPADLWDDWLRNESPADIWQDAIAVAEAGGALLLGRRLITFGTRCVSR